MTAMGESTVLTRQFWRSRRAAAVAGIIFAVVLIAATVMTRIALQQESFETLQTDDKSRSLVSLSLNLVPFAGIAFLWFIGVVREQLSQIEDRLFSTVFLGSGLLFLAMLFTGTVTSSSLVQMLAGSDPSAAVFAYGRSNTQGLISVYAMRMAAVFVLSVSTAGLRATSLPRWIAFTGYAAALALLVAGTNDWVSLVFPGWVLLVSLVILFTRPREAGVVKA